MRKTPLTRMATIAVLSSTLLLTLVLPGIATAGQSTDDRRELDGWIYGRGLAEHTPPTRAFSDDGWARGQGMRDVASLRRPAPGTFVDGWAVGQGMRSQSSVASTQESPTATDVPPPTLAIVAGLLLAALLGAGTAIVINHFRHVPSAR